MCDPSSLMSAGMGAGTKMMDAMGRQKAAQQQDKANKDHAMMELFLMDQHLKTQARYRGQGEAAWGAALDDMSARSQIARQSQEEARLSKYLNEEGPAVLGAPVPGSLNNRWWEEQPVNGGGASLATYKNPAPTDQTIAPPPSNEGQFMFNTDIAGSKQGGDRFQTDLAAKIADASRGARKQINALARLSSYGGSFGGLGTNNPLIMQNSANAIDLWNNFRRGDMQVYNVEKQIPASQYQYKQSPLMSLSGLFGAGMKGMGGAAGGGLGGGGMF